MVERDAVDLHCDRRNHIGGLVALDELAHRFNIDRLVGNDIRGYIFAAARLVKRLYGGVLYSRELADNALDLAELDAEAADLDLTVVSADKVNISVAHNAHDIAGTVGGHVALFIRERIGYKHLRVLFGAVEVASADLMTRDDELAGYAEGYSAHMLIDNILLHIEQRLADGNAVIELVHGIHMSKNGALCGTVAVVQLKSARRLNGNKLFSGGRKVMRIFRVGEQLGVLSADLCSHKGVGDFVFGKIFIDLDKVKTDALVNNMQLTAYEQHGVHIEHMAVEAVARVRRSAACFVHFIGIDVPVAEAAQVVVLKHNALGHAG